MSSLTLHVENFSRPLLPQKQGKGNTSKADVPELFVTDTLCSVHCRRDLADAISTGVSAQLNSDGSRNATASARAPKPDSIELCNHRSTHSPPEPTLEEILNMYERGFTGDESKGHHTVSESRAYYRTRCLSSGDMSSPELMTVNTTSKDEASTS